MKDGWSIMILAVLGDVNGNVRALRAALAPIEKAGILTILQTGNLVAGHGEARDVLALVEHSGVVCVQGVRDRQVVRFRRKEPSLRGRMSAGEADALAVAHAALSSSDLELLRRLPSKKELHIDRVRIVLCHGSISNPADILDAQTPLMKFQRQRELAPVDMVVCGGAREAFHVQVGGTLFVGPGWVDHAPGIAGFTLVDSDTTPWTIDSRSVHYE